MAQCLSLPGLAGRLTHRLLELDSSGLALQRDDLTVAENLPSEWKVLEESHPHTKAHAYLAEWSVPVPAEGEAKLTYRMQITYRQ